MVSCSELAPAFGQLSRTAHPRCQGGPGGSTALLLDMFVSFYEHGRASQLQAQGQPCCRCRHPTTRSRPARPARSPQARPARLALLQSNPWLVPGNDCHTHLVDAAALAERKGLGGGGSSGAEQAHGRLQVRHSLQKEKRN